MPFNGAGVFSRSFSWVTDKNNGLKITASREDSDANDIASGLSNVICRDGQSTVAADIPWNNKRLMNLGDATADGDAVSRQIADARYLSQSAPTLGGTATAYTLTLASGKPASLSNGLMFWANANVANTGGATTLVVTPNGGSAFASKKIKVLQSGTESDPGPSYLVAGNRYLFLYDSSADSSNGAYILVNPSSTGKSLITSGTLSNAATLDLTLPSGYRDFYLVLSQIEPVSAGAILNMRLSFDNGSTFKAGATDYDQTGTTINAAGTSGGASSTGGAAISASIAQAIAGGQGGQFHIRVTTPDVSGQYTTATISAVAQGNGTSLTQATVSGRCIASSARATNARLLYSSGNINAGRYQLYGLRN